MPEVDLPPWNFAHHHSSSIYQCNKQILNCVLATIIKSSSTSSSPASSLSPACRLERSDQENELTFATPGGGLQSTTTAEQSWSYTRLHKSLEIFYYFWWQLMFFIWSRKMAMSSGLCDWQKRSKKNCDISLSIFSLIKASRNARKHKVNEGGGHIWQFLDAMIPKRLLKIHLVGLGTFSLNIGGGGSQIKDFFSMCSCS